MPEINLSKPTRTIHVGVILCNRSVATALHCASTNTDLHAV